MKYPSKFNSTTAVPIDAMQWETDDDLRAMVPWIGENCFVAYVSTEAGDEIQHLTVNNAQGGFQVHRGDWVIKGPDDEFGVMGEISFRENFQPVQEPTPESPGIIMHDLVEPVPSQEIRDLRKWAYEKTENMRAADKLVKYVQEGTDDNMHDEAALDTFHAVFADKLQILHDIGLSDDDIVEIADDLVDIYTKMGVRFKDGEKYEELLEDEA